MAHLQFLTLLLAIDFAFLFLGYGFKRRLFVGVSALMLIAISALILTSGVEYGNSRDLTFYNTTTAGNQTNGTLTYENTATTDSTYSWGFALAFVLMAIIMLVDIVDFTKDNVDVEGKDTDSEGEGNEK